MVGHGGSSAGSYLADPTSLIPSHCASIVVTSTLRVKRNMLLDLSLFHLAQLVTSSCSSESPKECAFVLILHFDNMCSDPGFLTRNLVCQGPTTQRPIFIHSGPTVILQPRTLSPARLMFCSSPFIVVL